MVARLDSLVSSVWGCQIRLSSQAGVGLPDKVLYSRVWMVLYGVGPMELGCQVI